MNLPLTRSLPRQLKKIVRDSEIMKEDDNSWPQPDKVGRQELEIVLDGEVLFCVFPALFFGPKQDMRGLSEMLQSTLHQPECTLG